MSKKKFIIAVCGTQNTGKSTFVKDLIEYYKNNILVYPFKTNEIDYRKKIESAGLKINRNGNLESQKIIFDCLFEQLFKALADDNVFNFISDRSPLDAYCYTVYLKEHNPELGISDNDLDMMFEKLKRIARIYDHVFLIDLDNCENVKVVDDKFRDTDLEYRKEIDIIFKNTINQLGIEIRQDRMIKGSRQERIKQFVEKYQSEMVEKDYL